MKKKIKNSQPQTKFTGSHKKKCINQTINFEELHASQIEKKRMHIIYMQLLPIHSFFLRTKKGKSFRVVLFHFKKKKKKLMEMKW